MEPVPANALDNDDLILIPVRIVDTDMTHDGEVRITYQAIDGDGDNPGGGVRADHSTLYMRADPTGDPDGTLFRQYGNAF